MKVLRSFLVITLLLSMLCMTSCFSFVNNKFGEFGYYNKYLTKYSKKEITVSQAKEIINNNANACGQSYGDAIPGVRDDDMPLPPDELVTYFISEYADCQVETTYYINRGNEETKNDYLQGTDFKNMIEVNSFIPFNQVVAKMVIIFPEIIDYMEDQNEDFKASEKYHQFPFKTLYSYHTDSKGNLVIQCRDFAEIPASEAGGVACNYRQDTEIVFDKHNKIQAWQTSLGIYTATPTGTMTQGYILSMNFIWNDKK